MKESRGETEPEDGFHLQPSPLFHATPSPPTGTLQLPLQPVAPVCKGGGQSRKRLCSQSPYPARPYPVLPAL